MWKLDDTQKSHVCARYVTGERPLSIAKDYGVSDVAIRGIVRRRGIRMRSNSEAHRHIDVNQASFAKSTPEALYWAGFMMADGTIIAGNTIAIVLSAKDEAHLLSFRKFLASEHKLTNIHTPPSAPAVRFAVRCKQLVDDLAKWGVVPNKSKTAKATFGAAKSRDFWRGVVDGDGWLALVDQPAYFNKHPKINAWSKPRTYARLEVCGSESLMQQFLQFALGVVPACRARVRPHKSIYRVGLAGASAENVIAELYHDCVVGLPRKVHAARNILTFGSRCRTSVRGNESSDSLVPLSAALKIARREAGTETVRMAA